MVYGIDHGEMVYGKEQMIRSIGVMDNALSGCENYNSVNTVQQISTTSGTRKKNGNMSAATSSGISSSDLTGLTREERRSKFKKNSNQIKI